MKFLRLQSIAEYHSRLLDLFNRSSHLQTADELRRSRLLIGMLAYALLLVSIMAVVRIIGEGFNDSTRVAVVVPGFMASLLVLIVTTKKIKLVADLSILVILSLILTMAYFDGGLTSRVLTWLPALPLLANFVAHRLRAIPTLLLTCAGLACLFYADSQGLVPIKATADPLIGRMLAGMMSVLFITFVALNYEQSRQEAEKEIVAAKKMAEDLTQLKSEFLANMSHDLRTPMNGVLGMLNLLMREDLTESQQHRARLAHSSAASLLSLLNDILDFSKFEAGKMDLEKIEFDPYKLLGEICESLALTAQDKGLELILDFNDIQHQHLMGDAAKVRQLFTNLIGNAIKFTSEGEIIVKISTELQERRIVFRGSVQDTGVGIEEAARNQLFSAFTQADSSITRRFGGTGLGLAICKKLCEAMEGSIQVESTFGKGSNFHFNIILDDINVDINNDHQDNFPSTENKTLLIIEDNLTNASVLCKQCTKWGLRTLTAESKEQAWERLQKNDSPKIDIVLIDMDLDGSDGLAWGKEILNLPALQQTQLILMTPMAVQLQSDELLTQGFSAHFPKPATYNDLKTSLTKALDPTININLLQQESTRHTQSKAADALNILMVEDNPINQEVALGILEDAGHKTSVTNNGQEAIELLNSEEKTYDLILMDCQMPIMDGFEASRQIRSGEAGTRYLDIPIIALTANAMKGDRDRCLAVGMNDYLTKPLEPEALDQTLDKWGKSSTNKKPTEPSRQRETPRSVDKRQPASEIATRVDSKLWDYKGALKRFRGNHKLLLKLSKQYVESAPKLWKAAIEDLEACDFSSLENHIHGLKGTSGNLGCTDLYESLVALEKSKNDWEGKDSLTEFNRVEKILENTLNHIRDHHIDDQTPNSQSSNP